jgi:tRNA pseudouridine38-40 synthase
VDAPVVDAPVVDAPTVDAPVVDTPIVDTPPSTLTPLELALRDVKAAYVAAKRRWRVTPARLERLQTMLSQFEGTHNFYNYTIQKAFRDPSAKRHIRSFRLDPAPLVINDTEWLSIKVHGQSFMMHQIRKMVGLASLMVRCATPVERIAQTYEGRKIAIPKAPGLGLLLERPVFESYNAKATGELARDPIDFGRYPQIAAFKEEYIYRRMFEVEEREHT